MRKFIAYLGLFIFCLAGNGCRSERPVPLVVAYATSWSEELPDPSGITHINYAFGHIADSCGGIRIDNEPRLREIAALKKANPKLKVLLAIGGWGSGGFSETAASTQKRTAFAAACAEITERFGLDGIDIDWEYPASTAAGISASPADTENFTRLMQELRTALGPEKLLTAASEASAKYIDFAAVAPYVDFINIMAYDIAVPPFHHAPLFRSERVQGISCEESVEAHIAAGMPVEKLVLGMPFYGRGTDTIGTRPYRELIRMRGYERRWDDRARAPYLTDAAGRFACSYENERSIEEKCRYLLRRGLAGAMYWEYGGDDGQGTLRKAVCEGLRPR